MVSMRDSMLKTPNWSFCWSALSSRMFFMIKMTFSMNRLFESRTIAFVGVCWSEAIGVKLLLSKYHRNHQKPTKKPPKSHQKATKKPPKSHQKATKKPPKSHQNPTKKPPKSHQKATQNQAPVQRSRRTCRQRV